MKRHLRPSIGYVIAFITVLSAIYCVGSEDVFVCVGSFVTFICGAMILTKGAKYDQD